MSRRLRLALFAAGSVVFAILLHQLGIQRLVANLRQTGWTLVPIVLVYLPVYACWTAAWRLVLADEPARPGFWHTYAISISSFTLNFVTPLLGVGGEPFRAGAVAPWIGGRRAAASVVTYYLLHALSNLCFWLTAIVVALVAYARDPALVVGLAIVATVLVGLIALVFSRQREGVFRLAHGALRWLPVTRRLADALDAKRPAIEELDARIGGFYRRGRGRFLLALGVDYAGRCLDAAQYYLIARSVGIAIGCAQAIVIGGFGTLTINLLFFLPLEMGSREGGLYLVFHMLGLTAALGVYAAIVTRLRELAWVGIGLGLIWLVGAPAEGRETLQVPAQKR